MKDYKRITNTNLDEFNPRYAFCKSLDYLCKNSCDYQGCARKGGDCENYKQFIKMYNRLYELEDKIEQGRLVEPKKASLYIVEFDFFNCSNCGCQMPNDAAYTKEAEEMLKQGKHYNYCPNCGAELRGGE